MQRKKKGNKRNKKKHWAEEGSQMDVYKSVRKPKVRGTQVHGESRKKSRQFDWRDEINED